MPSITIAVFAYVRLHIRIVGSATAFGHHPIDVLSRVLDVAGFAVNAVLGIHLQPHGVAFLYILVNAGGAKPDLGSVVVTEIDFNRNLLVLQLQMAGLSFLVVGGRKGNIGQLVERDGAVGFGIVDLGALGGFLEGRMIGAVGALPRNRT